ncbi:hypothetical protein BD413DRAFT_80564 [Trametes elegans]|nr:hypothetical protein BD413DRAFT_80564 [Trametes elegans]
MADVFKNVIQCSRTGFQMFSAAWPSVPYDCSFWPVRVVERYQVRSGYPILFGTARRRSTWQSSNADSAECVRSHV